MGTTAPTPFPSIDEHQPVVYVSSRYTSATHSPARHIDDSTGHPLCKLDIGTQAKASISYTQSTDVPTCKKCRTKRALAITEKRQSETAIKNQAEHTAGKFGVFEVNVEPDADGVYHIKNAPLKIIIGGVEYRCISKVRSYYDHGHKHEFDDPHRYKTLKSATHEGDDGRIKIVKDANENTRYGLYKRYITHGV